ncbi:M56 family metallopeptidase [Roseivirga sp. UBA838]|uniref:M56 family metallopeptidase n=1 Tax=Roseivirga sp. UBA838 TaxID=1947393 RepID=UPI002579E912|nr:M56 family metallopeptidase [Roseivirga sp. UBA838]|tara:strand:- start:5083 stop:7143 length:2061 start_codon:yes stop_codon:yes gene_type:complete
MEINSNILEAIGLGLVHSLWQGAALLFVVLLGLISLRNKKAKTRYTLVLMGILALPVLLAGNLYFFWPASPVENSGTIIASEIRFSPNIISDFQAFAQNPQSSSTVLWIKENAPTIAVIWIVGMAFFLLKVLGSFIWMKRLLTKAFPLEETSINSLICNIKLVLGIKKPLQIKCSSWIKSPVILGFTRPTVLFPIGLIEGLSTEEVEAILYHELAHLKRNDFVINIIINVLQIVFFYHPAYWWMKSQLDNEREYATDELALKYSEKKLPMIKALAKVQAFSMNQPGLAFAGNSKNQVLKRINIMMNSKQQPNWLSAIFTIALLLVAFGLMSVQDIKPKIEKKENSSALSEVQIDLNPQIEKSDPTWPAKPILIDLDTQIQDNDSTAVSKAILELVNNPKAYEFKFGSSGEVLAISKNSVELVNPELFNFKQAYTKLNTYTNTNYSAVNNELEDLKRLLQLKETEIANRKFPHQQVFLNDQGKVDSIVFNGKTLEGEDKERKIKELEKSQEYRSKLTQLRQIEVQYAQVRQQLEQILKPGNQLDQVEVQKIQEYEARLRKLEDELVVIQTSKIRSHQAEKEALERRLKELNEQLASEKDYSELSLPGGDINLSLAEMLFRGYDAISNQKLIMIDDSIRDEKNLKDINDIDMERIQSIQVIKGEKMEEFVPKKKLKGIERIIRIVYRK